MNNLVQNNGVTPFVACDGTLRMFN